jgi:hypothetical protein
MTVTFAMVCEPKDSSSSPAGTSKMLIKVTLAALASFHCGVGLKQVRRELEGHPLVTKDAARQDVWLSCPILPLPDTSWVYPKRYAARSLARSLAWPLPSGLAGSAEVSSAQGWVPKIVSAKRLETIFGCP